MAIAVHLIRQRVAAALTGAGSGWTESAYAHGVFGRTADEMDTMQFAVGTPESITEDKRHARTRHAFTRTTVAVRYAYWMKGGEEDTDYDDALIEEAHLVAAAYDKALRTNMPNLLLMSARREVLAETQYLVGDLVFQIIHHMPLS